MLVIVDGDRAILVTQPAHATVSAQLARAWGNSRIGSVEPFDEVCLGALLHDIGWLDWEREPTLNVATGLPHSFLQLSTRDHLRIWESASRRSLAFGRYPALLTSMHFTGLYERFHDYDRDSVEDARDARALVARELVFQNELIVALRVDPATVSEAGDAVLERNRRLVAAWDGMSLAICHGLREPRLMRNIPDSGDGVDITLTPTGDEVSVDPWPFGVDRLTVQVDARVLTDHFKDQDAMRRALDAASWKTIETTLVPKR